MRATFPGQIPVRRQPGTITPPPSPRPTPRQGTATAATPHQACRPPPPPTSPLTTTRPRTGTSAYRSVAGRLNVDDTRNDRGHGGWECSERAAEGSCPLSLNADPALRSRTCAEWQAETSPAIGRTCSHLRRLPPGVRVGLACSPPFGAASPQAAMSAGGPSPRDPHVPTGCVAGLPAAGPGQPASAATAWTWTWSAGSLIIRGDVGGDGDRGRAGCLARDRPRRAGSASVRKPRHSSQPAGPAAQPWPHLPHDCRP